MLDEDPGEPDYVEAVEPQIGSDGAARWQWRFRDAAMAAEYTPQRARGPTCDHPVLGRVLSALEVFRTTR